MSALYNEVDPYAAAWLRNLIAKGLIAPGDVAECSIEDITPNDIRGYAQFHAYAGVGVWSYALRRAGWPDDRPVWSFSEPCQPYSAAGKRGGSADERYLRPATHHLVRVCRPPVVFGEQVSSKDALTWLNTLQADMEGEGYALGALDSCAAGIGAPHIRQRLYFAAERLEHASGDGRSERRAEPGGRSVVARCSPLGLADAAGEQRDTWRLGAAGSEPGSLIGSARSRPARRMDDDDDDTGLEGFGRGYPAPVGHGQGTARPPPEAGQSGGVAEPHGRQFEGVAEFRGSERDGRDAGRPQGRGGAAARRDNGGVAHADSGIAEQPARQRARSGEAHGGRPHCQPDGRSELAERQPAAGPVNGVWRDADWLFCRDGKWRPVRPGSFPLAHGAPSRVGRLRAYGNAIVAEAAKEFVAAYLDTRRFRLIDASDFTTDIHGDVFE